MLFSNLELCRTQTSNTCSALQHVCYSWLLRVQRQPRTTTPAYCSLASMSATYPASCLQLVQHFFNSNGILISICDALPDRSNSTGEGCYSVG